MRRRIALATVAVLGVVASTAEAHSSASPAGGHDGGGAGLLALLLAAGTAVAVIGAPLAGIARRLPALAVAVVVAAGLALSAPHLVHHVFDAEPEASCATLAIAAHADATLGEAAPDVASYVAGAAVADPTTPAFIPPARAERVRAPPA